MKNSNLKLYAPVEYWNATNEELSGITNGCGTSGWKGMLVPENIWGLPVSESCNIHDWMYHHGQAIEDKNEADRVFLNNMTRTINAQRSNSVVRKLRLVRANTYYQAVKNFGGEAFWANKNSLEEYRLSSLAHA